MELVHNLILISKFNTQLKLNQKSHEEINKNNTQKNSAGVVTCLLPLILIV